MRIGDFFMITNQYREAGWYWVVKTNDDSYLGALKLGEIKTGQDVKFDADLGEFKLGLRKSEFALTEWHIKPEKVKSNTPAIFTEDGKVIQPERDKFLNPDQSRNVNFHDEAVAKYTDIGRMIVLAGLGKIPTVGGGVAAAVGVLWPEMKPKVEDLINASEERMKAWVHGRIDELKRADLKNKIAGLRDNLSEYLNAKSQPQRGQKFNICLGHFNDAKAYFVDQNYTPGTISLAFDLATMHLALLRERVVHPREILGDDIDIESHKKTLKAAIATYQDFIKNVAIPGEMKWRERTLRVQEYGRDILGQAATVVRDSTTREIHAFSKSAGRREGNHRILFDYYKSQALTSYRLALEANIGDPAQLWTLLDPEQANAKPIPLDRVVWVGPCTGLAFKMSNEHDASGNMVSEDRPGIIGKIHVREYNEVDYIKLFYADHEGNGVGNDRGGEPHDFQLADGVFVNRVETWWDWELSAIKFDFTDGKSTGKLGSRTGMGPHYQVASYPSHRLSAVRFDDKKSAMWFGFSPMPDYYTPKEIKK